MSTLTIVGFSPQIRWPYGGTTAKLRLQYSANFLDSDNQQVLRGLYKDVDCTVSAGILTIPTFTLITTNDALVNKLATCSGRLLDSTGAARDWLFQNFVIPELLAPSSDFGALVSYNQGQTLDLPPSFYLDRDQTTALIQSLLAAVGLGPATDLAQGLVLLSIAAADPLNPVVWGTNDPLVRDALKWMGIDLDATMSAPADTNVPVYDALSGTWKPGSPIPAPTTNAQTGTSYTLQASDNGNVVTLDNANPITLIVPSGLIANFRCQIIQLGAGQVTFSASGTTINNRQGQSKTAGQYASCNLFAPVADTFILEGDTGA